ncbi:hypothetical protein K504DRAFT_477647 [Pleomassaria siparia CBS 279.74]|uniref:Uncharacterized protein n=1 Tax=Pleomassaria siparia CBS 279.74 TaxID=1314801 RepID=A0A6G1K5R9_9PLEO|nr:hypothetical protein K504DRAFT_477647 [Pleomassaria siparia CBS 279.74]
MSSYNMQYKLLRILYAKPPRELQDKFPPNTILRVFKTYYNHYKDKLGMHVSTYDPCLLCTDKGENPFSITGLQTNNTLSIITQDFLHREEEELHKAKLRAKPKTILGAYIASVCQPKADIKALNLNRTKLFIFTNRSFANNKDLSSQLSFLIVLANKNRTGDVKCKRVTRSVLASKLYGIVRGFDSAIALSTTIQQIIRNFYIPLIPLVICTDSKLLYNCLIKLSTTNKKRLIINIMSLRESKNNPANAFTKKAPNPALEQLISLNTLDIKVEAFVQRENPPIQNTEG